MGYLNVVEVESGLASLAYHHPGWARRLPLPHLSHEGRRCHALRIGRPGRRAPTLLVTGCVHAREWGGADIGVAWAADLLAAITRRTGLRYGEARASAEALRGALERVDVLVFPQVNPDGRNFSQRHDPLWRGNRRPDAVAAGGFGVDLNRNHDFLWDFPACFHPDAGVGTATSPFDASQTWRGPSPGSEPEARNLAYLFSAAPEIAWYVDLHSYGGCILFPWGDDESQSQDPAQSFLNPAWHGQRGMGGDTAYREYAPAADLARLRSLGQTMARAIEAVRGERYSVEPAFSMYPTSGAGDDWAYSRHRSDPSLGKVLPFTIEFGRDAFAPPWATMRPVIADVSAALTALTLAVAEGPAPR